MPLYRHVLRVDSHRSIELLTQNVGVSSVPTRLSKQVDQDVEQGHLGVLPPGHPTHGIKCERVDRRIPVLPDASVRIYDIAMGLLLSRQDISE